MSADKRPIISILISKGQRATMLTDQAMAELNEIGEVQTFTDPASMPAPELLRCVVEADVVVTGWGSPMLPIEAVGEIEEGIRAGRRVPLHICHTTGGIRRTVPEEMLRSDGFVVTNWGTSVSPFVAETALLLLLACTRRMRYRFDEVVLRKGRQGKYREGDTLYGRRVGFYGFGAIAGFLFNLLRPFGCECSYFDPYAQVDSVECPDLEAVASLDELFSRNEVLTLHAGLTEETRGTVDYRRLMMLPENAILVNTARGAIIDHDGLRKALQEKPLWCGFDVTSPEPPPADSFLLEDHHVIVTPHLGGKVGAAQVEAMSRTAVDNITRFLRGEPVESRITLERYGRMT